MYNRGFYIGQTVGKESVLRIKWTTVETEHCRCNDYSLKFERTGLTGYRPSSGFSPREEFDNSVLNSQCPLFSFSDGKNPGKYVLCFYNTNEIVVKKTIDKQEKRKDKRKIFLYFSNLYPFYFLRKGILNYTKQTKEHKRKKQNTKNTLQHIKIHGLYH